MVRGLLHVLYAAYFACIGLSVYAHGLITDTQYVYSTDVDQSFEVILPKASGTGLRWIPADSAPKSIDISFINENSAPSRPGGPTSDRFSLTPRSRGIYYIVWQLGRPGAPPFQTYVTTIQVK